MANPLFARKLDALISTYFSYDNKGYQKEQTLSEFIAEDLSSLSPDLMRSYLDYGRKECN